MDRTIRKGFNVIDLQIYKFKASNSVFLLNGNKSYAITSQQALF